MHNEHSDHTAPWLDKEAENAETVFGTNAAPDFKQVVEEGLKRRNLIKGLFTGAALAAGGAINAQTAQAAASTGLSFKPIKLSKGNDYIDVPEGYDCGLVIAWGNPVTQNAPDFDPTRQNGVTQSQQFGYNCDMITYHSLPAWNSSNSRRGLLCVNHEYTDPIAMFPGYGSVPTKDQVDGANREEG